MMWCNAYIKSYPIQLQIIFDLRIILQKQEQNLIILKDQVFNYMDFFMQCTNDAFSVVLIIGDVDAEN